VNETEHLGAFLGSLYHKTASIDKFFLHVQSDREEIDEKNTIIGSASRLLTTNKMQARTLYIKDNLIPNFQI